MIASVLIIAFSLVLFVYWFRYTCLLILSAKTTRDYAGEVARTNQLSFPQVQDQLRAAWAESKQHRNLHVLLERDFQLLTYLLGHAAKFQLGGYSVEERMLMVDYQVMKVWYSLIGGLSPLQARYALNEMTDIVGHFANALGERAVSRP